MSDFFLNAHSGWQYVTLIAAIVAVVAASRAGDTWGGSTTRIYSYAAIAVDVQVALGIILWIVASGWSAGLVQGWIHPIAGFGALGVVHAFMGRARTAADATSHRLVRTGFVVGLVLILVAIALGELAA